MLCLDEYCFKAIELSYLDGFFSNRSVIWDQLTAYEPLEIVPFTENYDVKLDLKNLTLCIDSYTCFTETEPITPESKYERE